eukprot:10667023-Karenia_brevis.AAC.1
MTSLRGCAGFAKLKIRRFFGTVGFAHVARCAILPKGLGSRAGAGGEPTKRSLAVRQPQAQRIAWTSATQVEDMGKQIASSSDSLGTQMWGRMQ